MRAVIQRVVSAAVDVAGQRVAAIGPGLLILLGVSHEDTDADTQLLAEKTAQLRIFSDEEGKFNHSLIETGGAALVVSQFTLYANMRKGRRPNFTDAAHPDLAAPLVESYALALERHGIPVSRGVFGAMMQVSLVNDGPVTLVLDSVTLRQPRHA